MMMLCVLYSILIVTVKVDAFTSTITSSKLNFVSAFSQENKRVNFGKTTSLHAEKNEHHRNPELNRRSAFYELTSTVALSGLVSTFNVKDVFAEDGDLTSQMFNPDGSLKEGTSVSTEATFRTISLAFPDSEDVSSVSSPVVYLDGDSKSTYTDDKNVRQAYYKTPTKWTNDATYTDTTNGINLSSCNRIVTYQSPGKISSKTLEKASTVGVAKALQAQPSGKLNIEKADLVAGRKEERDGITYWNFDLAVAPLTCEGERKKEDLGLGFCPYDSIGENL